MEGLHPDERKGFFRQGGHLLWCIIAMLLIIDVALLYGIFFSSQGIPGYHQQQRQIEELQGKIRNLQKENYRLFERIQSLKDDPLAQEKLVRQHLGWTRPNEIVIEFPAAGDSAH